MNTLILQGKNPIFLSVTDKITLFARILEGMNYL